MDSDFFWLMFSVCVGAITLIGLAFGSEPRTWKGRLGLTCGFLVGMGLPSLVAILHMSPTWPTDQRIIVAIGVVVVYTTCFIIGLFVSSISLWIFGICSDYRIVRR